VRSATFLDFWLGLGNPSVRETVGDVSYFFLGYTVTRHERGCGRVWLMADKDTYEIFMFFGIPTTTDSYEFYSYMKGLCEPDAPKIPDMALDLDSKFPGIHGAMMAATREITDRRTWSPGDAHLDFTDGMVRATYDGKTSAWYATSLYEEKSVHVDKELLNEALGK